MLALTRKAFGGLGRSCIIRKYTADGEIDTRYSRVFEVDLQTGDAVLGDPEDKSVHSFTTKVFTQDELQAAVSAGIADHLKTHPAWKVSDYPELDAWLKYEQVKPATPAPAAE